MFYEGPLVSNDDEEEIDDADDVRPPIRSLSGIHRLRSSTVESYIGRQVTQVTSTVVGVVDGAKDLVVGVAATTPGLKDFVVPRVHR